MIGGTSGITLLRNKTHKTRKNVATLFFSFLVDSLEDKVGDRRGVDPGVDTVVVGTGAASTPRDDADLNGDACRIFFKILSDVEKFRGLHAVPEASEKRGPPLSPWHESLPPSGRPAQTMFSVIWRG